MKEKYFQSKARLRKKRWSHRALCFPWRGGLVGLARRPTVFLRFPKCPTAAPVSECVSQSIATWPDYGSPLELQRIRWPSLRLRSQTFEVLFLKLCLNRFLLEILPHLQNIAKFRAAASETESKHLRLVCLQQNRQLYQTALAQDLWVAVLAHGHLSAHGQKNKGYMY